MQHVSLVIPCFNEGDTIAHLRDRLFNALGPDLAGEFEIVFVDDGSTDDTLALLSDNFSQFENTRVVSDGINRGIAGAIQLGMQQAQYEIVCSMDSDCTYAPEDIPRLLDLLEPDVALVIGSPYHPQGRVHDVPAWRIRISKIASRIYRFVLKSNLDCYTSCFRVYRKHSCATIPLENSGYTGIAEMIWQLELRGQRVVECPVDLRPRQFGHSKLKLVPVVYRHLNLMLAIAVNRCWRKLQWLLTG